MIDDELSPDLRALFDAEQRRDDALPPGARDRVAQALTISLGIGIGAAAGSASATSLGAASAAASATSKGALAAGAAATSTATATATTATAAATSAAAGVGVTATGGALAKGLAFALVTAMAGTTGTGIYLAARDEPQAKVVEVRQSREVPASFDPSLLAKKPPPPLGERPTRVKQPVVAPVEVAPVEVAPVEVAPVEVAPVEIAPVDVERREAGPVELRRATHVLVTPEQKDERLRGERAVLDTARTAVARGDGGAALIALEAHRASYADGALLEEREALTVLALVKLGRIDDARTKAETFRRKHPRSLFLPAIDGALR